MCVISDPHVCSWYVLTVRIACRFLRSVPGRCSCSDPPDSNRQNGGREGREGREGGRETERKEEQNNVGLNELTLYAGMLHQKAWGRFPSLIHCLFSKKLPYGTLDLRDPISCKAGRRLSSQESSHSILLT